MTTENGTPTDIPKDGIVIATKGNGKIYVSVSVIAALIATIISLIPNVNNSNAQLIEKLEEKITSCEKLGEHNAQSFEFIQNQLKELRKEFKESYCKLEGEIRDLRKEIHELWKEKYGHSSPLMFSAENAPIGVD